MIDSFSKALWELGVDNPDAQRAIADSITGNSKEETFTGYSIPTRQYCEATGEVEDIHTTALIGVDDEEKREQIVKNIKKIDSMTIGELARTLNYVRVAYLVKEAEGKEVQPPEQTLRDIDITLLAFYAVKEAPKVIGRTSPIVKEDGTILYKGKESKED